MKKQYFGQLLDKDLTGSSKYFLVYYIKRLQCEKKKFDTSFLTDIPGPRQTDWETLLLDSLFPLPRI